MIGRGNRFRLSSSSSSGSSYSTGGVAQGVVSPEVMSGALIREAGRSGAQKRGCLEDEPVKIPSKAATQKLNSDVLTSTPISSLSTRPPFQLPDASIMSTPGGVPFPPNPPPTPVGGVGGVPVPPPPPPSIPGVQQGHLKRVNWEKLHGTDGTIWKEASPLAIGG